MSKLEKEKRYVITLELLMKPKLQLDRVDNEGTSIVQRMKGKVKKIANWCIFPFGKGEEEHEKRYGMVRIRKKGSDTVALKYHKWKKEYIDHFYGNVGTVDECEQLKFDPVAGLAWPIGYALVPLK